MKKLTLTLMLVCAFDFIYAQNKVSCTGHPLFTAMPNHSVKECDEKEFDQLEIIQKEPGKSAVTLTKQGQKLKVAYAFNGDFAKRPSMLQITENYANAIQKAGGQVLSKSEATVYGKLKKGDAVYWIQVTTDGSSYYWITSIKEQKMKQDVVVTAAEIKNNLKDEGKAVFYGIYFDTDKATLKPESAPTLAEIAKFLKGNPSVNVFIVGHTDNTGDLTHNITLSKDRAAAVTAELVSKLGVNKSQVNAQGIGPLAPLASNTTEQGRAKNRRVELVIK